MINIITATKVASLESTFTHQCTQALIILFACSIVLSTSAASVCVCLLALIWLFDKDTKMRWQFYFNYPLAKPILAFMILTLIGMIDTRAPLKDALSTGNHVLRLGIIPMLAYYLQPKGKDLRKWVLIFFVSAILFTIFCTCLKVYLKIPIGQRTYGNDVFKNHIVTSYFTAMGLFLVSTWFVRFKPYRIANAFIMAFMLYYLVFLNTGRIGYVIFFICFAVFAWHQYRLKGMLAICLAFCVMMLLAYQFSAIFTMRFNEFYNEFLAFHHGTTVASIGKRLEFLQNSLQLFWQQPLFGWGTGSFEIAYQTTFAAKTHFLTDNPHNQYLKTGIELGVLGLFALLWLFISQWKMTKSLKGYDLILAQGFLLAFFIGCLFNSWLDDFTEFLFYCLMSAHLLPSALAANKVINHKADPLNAIAPSTYP